MNYILLPDRTIRAEPDLMTWAKWHEDSENRHLAKDRNDQYLVSTVFLGIDHNYGEGEPILFETMVFEVKKGDIDYSGIEEERYTSYDDAMKGHEDMCKRYIHN